MDVKEKKYRWTKDYLMTRRSQKKDYLNIFKRKKRGYTLSEAENARLVELEKQLSFDDIKLYVYITILISQFSFFG